jgi:WD40 repeat protein
MFNAVFFESAGYLSASSKISSAAEKKVGKAHSALTCGVAAPRADSTVFAGRQDGEVVAWQLSRGKSTAEDKPSLQSKLRVLGSHKGSVTCLAYYPARKLLFSGSSDSQVAMWDPFQVYQRSGTGSSAARLQLMPAHDATVTAMAVHCNVLVTGSVDKTVKIWMFDERREGLAIPLLIAKQAFVFDNWITTIFSTLTKATEVQTEDIFVGDASGNVTSLHSVMTPMVQKGSVEDNGVLQVELVRHKRLAEGTPMLPGSGDAVPRSVTAILPIPTVNSMVTLGFGHYALITDTVKGSVLSKVEHPDCTGSGGKGASATRFGAVLYLSLREEMILMDNAGAVFLWDSRTNQFLCQRSVGSGNHRARGLMDFPSQHGAGASYLRSADEQFLVLLDEGIEIISVVHVRAVTELKGHEGRVIGVQVNHLSEYAALSATTDEESPAQGHGSGTETQDVAFVTAGVDNKVCLWSSRLSLVRAFTEKFSEISSFCFLPHLDFCVTGHDNGSVKFWGLGSDRSVRFTAHDNTISFVAEGLHRLEKRTNEIVSWHHLFTISYDGCLAVWEMPVENSKPKCEGRVRVSNSELVCGVYDPIAHSYIVGDNDGIISMWSVDELRPLRRFQHSHISGVGRVRPAHSEAVTTITLDGNIAISGGEDGRIFMWNSISGECLKEFNTTSVAPEYTAAAASGWGEIQQLHVNSETGDLIACTRSGVVLQFDQSSGLPTAFFKAQTEISALSINPYGREVILGLDSGLVVRAPLSMFKTLTVAFDDDVE